MRSNKKSKNNIFDSNAYKIGWSDGAFAKLKRKIDRLVDNEQDTIEVCVSVSPRVADAFNKVRNIFKKKDIEIKK